MDKSFERLLQIAITNNCTDIHFNIIDRNISIVMRTIKGLLEIPTNNDDLALFNYLQYKAHLDSSLNRPQTGSFTYFYNYLTYDFRLAVVDSSEGRSGVLRILNCHNGLTINDLTYEKQSQEKLKWVLKQKSGLVLFSGLTGTGKTTTMYSLLKLMKDRIIYSLEDPIEVRQNNIKQIEINEKLNLTYDEGIKQILRHNPDVLMIGEIRDEQTAKMAIRAALTGVLVVSSIHSFDCYNAINRMLELQAGKSDFTEVTMAIFNQRLMKLKNSKKYTCIYQWIDNNEIRQYLKDNVVHHSITSKISKAISEGIIE